MEYLNRKSINGSSATSLIPTPPSRSYLGRLIGFDCKRD
jgi:hypothetical protein